MSHSPVLLQEIIHFLPQKISVAVDATINGGGHALAIGSQLTIDSWLVGIDADIAALQQSQRILSRLKCHVRLIQGNFRRLKNLLVEQKVKEADLVLWDLGFSSNQLTAGRGFSFQVDEPLLMTFTANPDQSILTAQDIVNDWEEETLADIIYAYGGEKFARRISRAIIVARKNQRLTTSKQLAELVQMAVPKFYQKARLHPATRTFQALRIAVNDELNALRESLDQGWEILRSKGRLLIITFHSLEGRIVKEFFKHKLAAGEGKMVTRRAVAPTREEVITNPRARSAKLRLIEKI